MGTAFWAMLWRNPQRAYTLGMGALLLGFALGWLGLRAPDIQIKFACVLGASFLFSLWCLLTCVGAMATYAAALGKVLGSRDARREETRSEDPA